MRSQSVVSWPSKREDSSKLAFKEGRHKEFQAGLQGGKTDSDQLAFKEKRHQELFAGLQGGRTSIDRSVHSVM
jgi:hypothetical protein